MKHDASYWAAEIAAFVVSAAALSLPFVFWALGYPERGF